MSVFSWNLPLSLPTEEALNSTLYALPKLELEEVMERLRTSLTLQDLKIGVGRRIMRGQASLAKNIEDPTLWITLYFPLLNANIHWVSSREVQEVVMEWMTGENAHWEQLEEAFFHFFFLNILEEVMKDPALTGLAVQCLFHGQPCTESCSSFDITVSCKEQGAVGRLLIPTSFQNAWIATKRSSLQPQANLQLEAGLLIHDLTMSEEELLAISPGDVILLPKGRYDPDSGIGSGKLALQGLPLFEAQLSKDKMKLTSLLVGKRDG